MKDDFKSFILTIIFVVAIIAIVVFKIFTGIEKVNKEMINNQKLSEFTTEISTNSEKTTKMHYETTTEITTINYELLKYDVLDNIDICEYRQKAYMESLVSAHKRDAVEFCLMAEEIKTNSKSFMPNHEYEKFGGNYFEIIEKNGNSLLLIADSIVNAVNDPDNMQKYITQAENNTNVLVNSLPLVEKIRTQWLKDCGWFTDEEIGWLTSK